MNTKDIVLMAKSFVGNTENSEKSAIKVIDSVLHSGFITVGNENDKINCILRVAPNLDADKVDEIFTGLAESGVQEGEKLYYELTDDLKEGFVYNYKLGDLILAFYRKHNSF